MADSSGQITLGSRECVQDVDWTSLIAAEDRRGSLIIRSSDGRRRASNGVTLPRSRLFVSLSISSCPKRQSGVVCLALATDANLWPYRALKSLFTFAIILSTPISPFAFLSCCGLRVSRLPCKTLLYTIEP